MRFDNVWRLSTAQALAVASVGGAAASSAAFGAQTYAVQLAFPGSVSSTSGCRIAIVSPNDNAVSSTAGTLLPANWIEVVRCSPGQRVSAISNGCGDLLALDHRADRLMAQDWTENLTPDEARAALDALKAHQAPVTAREATELLKLRRALQAKAEST